MSDLGYGRVDIGNIVWSGSEPRCVEFSRKAIPCSYRWRCAISLTLRPQRAVVFLNCSGVFCSVDLGSLCLATYKYLDPLKPPVSRRHCPSEKRNVPKIKDTDNLHHSTVLFPRTAYFLLGLA